MVVTDHNEVVLRVLQHNATANPAPHPVRCDSLPGYRIVLF